MKDPVLLRDQTLTKALDLSGRKPFLALIQHASMEKGEEVAAEYARMLMFVQSIGGEYRDEGSALILAGNPLLDKAHAWYPGSPSFNSWHRQLKILEVAGQERAPAYSFRKLLPKQNLVRCANDLFYS